MTLIEDYAFIGDLKTGALVSRDGSIDWLCLPNFDSAACFAALLGDHTNGRWAISPAEDVETTREYRAGTLTLITTHTGPRGTVRVTDAMPTADARTDIVRRIEGVSGTLTLEHLFTVRFGYGRIKPWVHRRPDHSDYGCEELILAVAGPDMLALRGPRLPTPQDGQHTDKFDVSAGEVLTFELTYSSASDPIPGPVDIRSRIHLSEQNMRDWVGQNAYCGDYDEIVERSLITLRGLTHKEFGGIVAAPTCSLPEEIGGERNWDYRYCWLRDSALTLEALIRSGFAEAALSWRDWLVRAVAGDPADLQIMYTINGGRDLLERTLDHLPGYENSTPVRIGNGAVGQLQTDVLGEVMCALAMVRETGFGESDESWALQRALVNNLCENWTRPDHGLWEIRGPKQHFTHSRVMVWAALDRAVRAVDAHGFSGPRDRWADIREKVRAEVLEKGVSKGRGCFTQHYETDEVDASLLVIPSLGFLPADDERFVKTVEAVESDLLRDGLVLRYRTTSKVDGLSGDESPFLACAFWLVSAYAELGRVEDARTLMDRLVGLANDVSLMSEEYDPHDKRQLGNMPQAFSHLALVMAACDLAAADTGHQDSAVD